MLEKAQEVTRDGKFQRVEYARFAYALVTLADGRRLVEQGATPVRRRGPLKICFS